MTGPITTTNFRDLPDDPRFEMQENGSLVIREARVEDAGYYLCHISNSVGMESKTATLTVFGMKLNKFLMDHTRNPKIEILVDVR